MAKLKPAGGKKREAPASTRGLVAAMFSLSNTLEFLRFPLLGPIDKLRLGLTILHAARLHDGGRA